MRDHQKQCPSAEDLKQSDTPTKLHAAPRPAARQVILYSEGFSGAKELSGKIVSLFSLSRQLLSRQQHYDWGLRALKAVLNTGGKLIQVRLCAHNVCVYPLGHSIRPALKSTRRCDSDCKWVEC
jgi:Hydrolytic ATP binding site of dynein motor region